MLNILINDFSDEVIELSKTYKHYVSDYFDIIFDKSWFLDPYVVDIIKEIDNTVVNEDLTLYNEVLGGIVPSQLSSGCKGLILVYKTDCKIDGDRLGDNCWGRLSDIASKKDVDIVLRHIPVLPENFSAYLLNTNTIVNKSDYISNFILLVG